MEKQKLIETLEDLAAFFTLSRSNAEAQARTAKDSIGGEKCASFCSGRETAYGVAFTKLDRIIEEAKE